MNDDNDSSWIWLALAYLLFASCQHESELESLKREAAKAAQVEAS